MTLGQVAALIDGEHRFHYPKAGSASSRAEEGTVADLAMFAKMKVG